MKSFASRCLSLVAVALLLGACQSTPPAQSGPGEPPLAEGIALFQQHLSSGELGDAERQLEALRTRRPTDPRWLPLQHQLAETYLARGRQALQQGDLDTATQALSRARSLMPQAPALTAGRGASQALLSQNELNAADRAQSAAREAAERAEAARQDQARQLREAAERQAAAILASGSPDAAGDQDRARLIDPGAPSSTVSLGVLDSRDDARLQVLLDDLAADTVTFRCEVHFQVRLESDYQLLAAQLRSRIRQLEPTYEAPISHVVEPARVPQVRLSPVRH